MEKCCISCGWEGGDVPAGIPGMHPVFLLSLEWVTRQRRARGRLYSAALWIVAQPGPAQAFSGFPANLDGHKTKVLIEEIGVAVFVEAAIPPSQQQENVPSLGERGVRTELPACLAGPAGTGESRQSPPPLCPPLLVLIPPGISEKSCWTLFFMALWEGNWEELCAWQLTRGSALLLPLAKLCFWPP